MNDEDEDKDEGVISDEEAGRILTQFKNRERMKMCAGSGDDGFYMQQIDDYFNKQNGFWINAVKEFVELGEKRVKVRLGLECANDAKA